MKVAKVISVVLVSIFVFSLCGQAFALSNDVKTILPRYSYTRTVSAGLSMSSSGVASCYGQIVSSDIESEISLNVRLQKKEGSVWVLVKKWSASNVGVGDLTIDKDYSVEPGTYRVIASGIVTDVSGDFETVSCIANERTYTGP